MRSVYQEQHMNEKQVQRTAEEQERDWKQIQRIFKMIGLVIVGIMIPAMIVGFGPLLFSSYPVSDQVLGWSNPFLVVVQACAWAATLWALIWGILNACMRPRTQQALSSEKPAQERAPADEPGEQAHEEGPEDSEWQPAYEQPLVLYPDMPLVQR